MSPYEATKFYGHFLWGDEPKCIRSVKKIEKCNEKELHCEIEWKDREDGFKPSNSLIEMRTIEENAPIFMANFFFEKTQLLYPNKE